MVAVALFLMRVTQLAQRSTLPNAPILRIALNEFYAVAFMIIIPNESFERQLG